MSDLVAKGKGFNSSKGSILISIIITAIFVVLAFIPFQGLEAQAKGSLLIFFWVIFMWIFRPIPEVLSGILAAGLMIVLCKVSGTQVTSGFSSTGWWLTIFASMLGGVVMVTGIGSRLAHWLLVKMGTNQLTSMYATTMANNILSAFTPSNTARGAILSPIIDGICDSLGYERGKMNGDQGIVLANLFTNTTNTFLFFTATGANAIGMAIVTEATGKNITWGGWLLATCVPAIAILLIIPIICYKLYPPKLENKKVDVSFAKEKLNSMGPMSRSEKAAAIIMICTFIAWATESIHGIASATVAFFMVVALAFPKFGPCTWKEIEPKVPWAALIQLGFAMSLAGVVNSTGGFQWLVETIFMKNDAFNSLSFSTFMMIWLPVVVFLHIIFAGMNAMMAVIVPVGMTIANTLGFDPFTVGLMTVMAISAGAFFLPFNSAPNLIFYGTGRFTSAQQLKGGIIFGILVVIGMIFAFAVWWPLVGII